MRKTPDIINDLNEQGWKIENKNPFIEKVIFPALEDVLKDEEKIKSQIWGVRLDDKGLTTSEYELLTLTDKRIISLYSDLSNQNDKIRVTSQPIYNIHKIMTSSSEAHPKSTRVDIVLKGSSWSLESEDIKTVEHFIKLYNELSNPKDPEEEKEINILKNKHERAFFHFAFKGNRSIWKNENLWLLISAISAIVVIISSSIIFSSVSPSKGRRITAGVFQIIFALIGAASMVCISMYYWDTKKFSIELYKSLLTWTLFIIMFIFGIVVTSKQNYSINQTYEVISLVLSILIFFDSTYVSIKNYYNNFIK